MQKIVIEKIMYHEHLADMTNRICGGSYAYEEFGEDLRLNFVVEGSILFGDDYDDVGLRIVKQTLG